MRCILLDMRRLIWVALCPLLLSACMAPEATPSTTISIAPEAVLASVSATGGLCPDATCASVFTVHGDGAWTQTTGGQVEQGGTLPSQTLTYLTAAIASTTILSAPAFTGTCPIAYDGVELVYSWTGPDGDTHEVSSCDTAIPPDDPLVVALAAVEAQQAPAVSVG